jgi:regulator of sigma E protease
MVAGVSPGDPADRAGITDGSEILSIDGVPYKEYSEIVAYIKSRPETIINVTWNDDEGGTKSAEIQTLAVTVNDSLGNEKTEGRLGFILGPAVNYVAVGPIKAFGAGFSTTIFLTREMIRVIWRLVTRQESIKALGGPVMIAKQAGAAAKQGFLTLLGLAAFLSINLAILNVLPIPVLDGGHLVFLAIEGIKRRPVSIKSRLVAQQIGMGLLLLLMVVVTYNDIVRLFTGFFR